ncbi:hypothetical protein GLE_4024 [Lysobacter enzymogenes]|uniref:Uncharacterized protein n=1 Tax=Lysobacter enzymogenes TaxID=69 RepID=A0A0S2DL59_LYSEN|nr:hypothetical protein GLE_4024 [Lysobacter enzymogenes]
MHAEFCAAHLSELLFMITAAAKHAGLFGRFGVMEVLT